MNKIKGSTALPWKRDETGDVVCEGNFPSTLDFVFFQDAMDRMFLITS